MSKYSNYYFHVCLAPVVQRVDSTIHWITQIIGFGSNYLLDSSIHPLNNWALMVNRPNELIDSQPLPNKS